MRHLTILLTMAITFTGLAQQMPYNPDANGDDFVGVDDVLGVLGVYDTALMQPDLMCDYEGTDLELLLSGFMTGEIILDSIYVEYFFSDTAWIYSPPCPDPIPVETVLERSYMFTSFDIYSLGVIRGQKELFSYDREFWMTYNDNTGGFTLYIQDQEVADLSNFGARSYLAYPDWSSNFFIPFPEEWQLDEDGVEAAWRSSEWVSHCQSFRLIPFWHEAE